MGWDGMEQNGIPAGPEAAGGFGNLLWIWECVTGVVMTAWDGKSRGGKGGAGRG